MTEGELLSGCSAAGGRMTDEDEQVLRSDGRAGPQLWVLAGEEPPAGGKQKISL